MDNSTVDLLLIVYEVSIFYLVLIAFNKNTSHIFADNNTIPFVLFLIFTPIINTIVAISIAIEYNIKLLK